MNFAPHATACVLLFASFQLSAAEPQHFTLEKPYPVPEILEPACKVPVVNVILMIGDGMGLHHLGAAWAANRGRLFIENCPVTGIAKTWCADKLVTDSAAAGTAMATGIKTLYKRVAIDPAGNKLDSLADKAADMGKATGIIATCELNDATPAAFCANNASRSDAYGIIGDYPHSRADFIFGGGGKYFIQRPDGRDIFKEMEAQGYRLARSWGETAALPPGKTLAVAAPGNLPSPAERGDVLRQATLKALETLGRNPKGFFLMVEGSNIDKAAHRNKLAEMIEEILDFDRTAGAVLNWASRHPGTLVVITADHNTGAFALTGGNRTSGEITAQFGSGNHDGVAVPVYAFGAGSREFTGIYENTDIFDKILAAMGGKKNPGPPSGADF